jgi:pimeloyl-ACP methyl ester carboxylesterase
MMLIRASIYKSQQSFAHLAADYDRILNAWTVPYESIHVPTRFGETHVLACGSEDAPPLVLIHGASVHAGTWGYNVPDWCAHFRIYAPDICGEGGKSAPIRFKRGGIEETEWLTDIFDALKIKRAHLVGISLGGWMALMMARHVPERVNRVVALCPASLLPITLRFIAIGIYTAIFPTRENVRNLVAFLSTPGIALDEGNVNTMHVIMKHLNPSTYHPRIFRDHDLRSIRAPTLLLIGENEVIYNPQRALKRASRLIPNLKTELIPNAGHALNIDQRDIINPRVLAFLTETEVR